MIGSGLAIPNSGGSNVAPVITKVRAVPGTIVSYGADIVITRPNDTTAYAAGDVYADAGGDGRVHLIDAVAPATGVAGTSYYLSGAQYFVVRSGPNLVAATPSCSLAAVMFSAQPATVIADNAPLVISAADQLLLLKGITGYVASSTVNFTANTGIHNYGPAGSLRQSAQTNPFTPLSDLAAVGNVGSSFPLSAWAYLFFSNSTYVPTAQEVLTITPRYTWAVVPT